MEFYPNGALKEKYFSINDISGEYLMYNEFGQRVVFQIYENGIKSGDMFEFSNNSVLKSHILYEDGQAIYVGVYEEGKKIINSLLPVYENDVIRNDFMKLG